ncbi:hypothetical protein [Roseateles albus]|uniref:SARP family transcriptional regulator n=1 Tax=Roseateles albus TaxID=2987525 RepID=A0ABT5KJ63_9BURK|nr:hypothetical protein [Roseateles albus]MDC8772876.1 hypothetical protein [Roseateles albus]
MQIEIDARNNRAWLDGVTVQPRQQWLCAFLQLLVQSSSRAGRRLTRADLEQALQRFGRGAVPLHAKQVQRLVDGLRALFASQGMGEDFDARFVCEPAHKTAGPWGWTPQPGDALVQRGGQEQQGAAPSSSGVDWLPTLAAPESHHQAVIVAMQMQQAMAQQWDGNTALALEALDSPTAWEGASRKMLALRELKRADLFANLRDFDTAERCLDAAVALTSGRHTLADSVVSSMAHVSRMRLHYSRSPALHFQEILDAAHGVGTAQMPMPGEASPCGFADRWNLLMLCERRWLEAHVRTADTAAWAAHLHAMERLGHGALFMCLAAHLHERAQNICANLAYAYQRLSALAATRTPDGASESTQHLEAAIEWHALSLSYRLRFDLPDNSAYDLIFLGELWLSGPKARAAFERYAYHIAWLGLRPDEAEFYQRAWECASIINDPRQMAYCALNKLGFARHTRNGAIQDLALQELRCVLGAHPNLVQLLAHEGYAVPKVRLQSGVGSNLRPD